MTVYVLDPARADEMSVNRQTAAVGFTLRGDHVRLFEMDAFDTLPLVLGDIVVGGIQLAHRAMARVGAPVPALDSIPAPLAPFAGRRLWRATMADVRAAAARGEAVFVKPVPQRHKLFGGHVAQGFGDLARTAHIGDDEPVDCAEPVDFVSEYRGFVLHGALMGLRHYKGDPLAFPDAATIRAAMAAFTPAPASYALDVGVARSGATLVVEINDGYSSGAYGLSPARYAQVIAARWAEICAEAAVDA